MKTNKLPAKKTFIFKANFLSMKFLPQQKSHDIVLEGVDPLQALQNLYPQLNWIIEYEGLKWKGMVVGSDGCNMATAITCYLVKEEENETEYF